MNKLALKATISDWQLHFGLVLLLIGSAFLYIGEAWWWWFAYLPGPIFFCLFYREYSKKLERK